MPRGTTNLRPNQGTKKVSCGRLHPLHPRYNSNCNCCEKTLHTLHPRSIAANNMSGRITDVAALMLTLVSFICAIVTAILWSSIPLSSGWALTLMLGFIFVSSIALAYISPRGFIPK